jgi:tungstate transport system substrate-binding protein
MTKSLFKSLVACLLLSAGVTCFAQGLVMASTTSTEQSGLFQHLLPEFKKSTGIEVKVVALGTGQALSVSSFVALALFFGFGAIVANLMYRKN